LTARALLADTAAMPEPTPHALNRGFAWQPPRGPFRRVTAAQAERFDEQGFCVLEGAIAPDVIAAVTAEIDPWEEKVERVLQGLPDKKVFIARAGEITFTTHLVLRSKLLREFCAGALFQDVAHDLVGRDVRLYWDQAVYKKPGTEKEFPWHQDNGYTFVEPQQYLTCWVPLTDATLDNGCPWVVPGLHRRGTLAHWMTDTGWRCLDAAPDAVACPVRAGDVLVFSSLTPHRTGPNRSDAVRKAYIVQFAPDGARVVAEGAAGAGGTPCDHPERQYPILRGGAAVA
jgi:ectoine hydroxylase-related dioxygenase (phytanoyl-CoA dioxygenase family)